MNSEAEPVPASIGSYELVDRVAISPTGSVWRALDHALGRNVALKRVAAGAVQSVERLRAEAQVLAHLSHPNIVAVIDLMEADGQLWLVEEWVDGATLPDVIRQVGWFSATQAVGAVRGGLLGLAYAHHNGLVHGDVSPSNLLLDVHGTTKLIDFGLAQPAGAAGVAGTPGYLSPEAARGLPLVPASDVYSSAAVLALLLRGRPLFDGPSAEAVLAAQFRPGEPDLSGIDAPIRSVLQAALAPAPGSRPGDAAQLLAALDDAAVRTFGEGWLASASVAGLVGATVTAAITAAGTHAGTSAPVMANIAPAANMPPAAHMPPAANMPPAAHIGPAAQVGPAAPAGPGTPYAGHAGDVQQAGPGSRRVAQRGLRKVLGSHPKLAVAAMAGLSVAAVTVAAVVVSHQNKTPGHPVAAVISPSTIPSPVGGSSGAVGASPAAFDLHSVDWKSITLPGRTCNSTRDITLHNGQAAIPVASATPPGGYILEINIPPQYGPLANGGPSVAVLGLMCAGTGSYAGTGTFYPHIAVFDAQGNKPHLLGEFANGDLGEIAPLGVWLVPSNFEVRNGVIVINGKFLQSQDPHCCPSGRGTTTITYRNGALVPSKTISTTSAPSGAATSSASTSVRRRRTASAARSPRSVTPGKPMWQRCRPKTPSPTAPPTPTAPPSSAISKSIRARTARVAGSSPSRSTVGRLHCR